jgi:hypothetical protein
MPPRKKKAATKKKTVKKPVPALQDDQIATGTSYLSHLLSNF